MISATATSFSSSDEKEVRRLLLSAKPADNDTLLSVLNALPAPTTADLLAKIAEGAQRSQNYRGVFIGVFCIALLGSFAARRYGSPFPVSPVYLLGIWVAVLTRRKNANLAARKAAFLLSHRDDYRAIAPLANLWSTQLPTTVTALHECEELERALTRLLTALTANKYENLVDDAVRDLLSRAFPALPARSKVILTEEKIVLADLSETRADLLLAALRYLAHATPGKESPLTRELVARIAAYPVQSASPNRSLVHETAALCLDPTHRATPLAESAPVAQTAGIR